MHSFVFHSPIRVSDVDPSQFQRGTVHEEGEGREDGDEADDGGVEDHLASLHLGAEHDQGSGEHTQPARGDGCDRRERERQEDTSFQD